MQLVIIEIPIVPIPWKRPGGTTVRYDLQKADKARVRAIIKKNYPYELTEGAIRVDAEFEFPIPESWPKWRKEKALAGEERHKTKPDRDNVLKFIDDCLTSIIVKDDCQVDAGFIQKSYSIKPQTRLTIWRD